MRFVGPGPGRCTRAEWRPAMRSSTASTVRVKASTARRRATVGGFPHTPAGLGGVGHNLVQKRSLALAINKQEAFVQLRGGVLAPAHL